MASSPLPPPLPPPSRLKKFARARISRASCFGLRLTLGALALAAASLSFGMIAAAVMRAGPITLLDLDAARWFHAHATPALTRGVLFFTNLHSIAGIGILSMILGAAMLAQKERYRLLALGIAVPGGMLLNVLLKHAFQRPRPLFHDPLLTLETYSFPSGHTLHATLFYGVLAAYLVSRLQARRWKALAVFLCALMAALVGLSRIYLGVHYVSDVLAALAEGLGWLALALTAGATLRCQRERAAAARQIGERRCRPIQR